MIPLSLQRRVEALLQEHLDRMELASVREDDSLLDSSALKGAEDLNLIGNQEPGNDASVMEKILQRRSWRLLNLQRSWQVKYLLCAVYSIQELRYVSFFILHCDSLLLFFRIYHKNGSAYSSTFYTSYQREALQSMYQNMVACSVAEF